MRKKFYEIDYYLGSALDSFRFHIIFGLMALSVHASIAQDHTTTWIGNSDPTNNGHVMQDIENLYVSPSGKVYCITHWDEGVANVQVYESNGTLNPKPEESGTGSWGRSSGRAVTGDDTYVYQAFRQNGCDAQGGTNSFGGSSFPPDCDTEWQGVRRYTIATGKGAGYSGGAVYDGSMLRLSTNGKVPVGLAWYNNELYVADPNDNSIKVYSTNPFSGNLVRSWNVSRPGQLAFDGNGFLWMLQPIDGNTPAKLIRYSTSGALQSQSITFNDASKVVRGFGIDRVNHKLFICNNGYDQNILIYSNITSSPSLSGTFGNTQGIYSGTPGIHAPLKFEGPSGVGVDNAGNIYVANRRDVNCEPQDGLFGMFLEKYNASGTRQWVKYALEFSDVADVDPGSENGDLLDIYTKAERFAMDLSKPAGQDWIWKSSTIDFRTYPNDPRKIINHNDLVSSPFVRRLNGNRFLFVTNMVTNWLHVYRFEEGTEIGIPTAVFAGANWAHFFPYEPTGSNNNRWLWLDKNGDGQFQANEYDVGATGSGNSVEGWCVDVQGNVWRVSTNGIINKFNFGGVDGNGVPIYSSSDREVSTVSTFNNLKRAEYIPSQDVMILTGFTDTYNGDDFKSAGRVIARYNNWSSGNRTPTWTRSVPYKEQGDRDHMISIAVAGDYIFTVNVWPSLTRIYKLSDGSFVGTLDVNNGVEKKGWADLTHSIRAYKRNNGEYLVLLEENGAAKIVIYRWCPTGNCTSGGGTSQAPYGGTPRSIPGTIQAEDFDLGGQGIAYNDSDAINSGGVYRVDEGVDIEVSSEGGYNVGWAQPGEWMEYTVNAVSGAYDLQLRVASPNSGKQAKLYLDNNLLGTFNIPNTGGWQNWQTVTLPGVNITGGNNKILKLECVTNGFNTNWIKFESTQPAGQTVTIKVNSSANDAEETISNGSMNLNSDDLDIRSEDVCGMRFRLNVPQGATISSSSLQFVSKGNHSNANNFTFTAEANDNAAGFTSSAYNISSRQETSSSVTWNPGSWTDGNIYTTANLASIIQEVVNRPNWVANNFVVIMVRANNGNNNKRQARTFDYNNNNSQSPGLTVNFTPSSGTCTWAFAANEGGTVTTSGAQQVRFGANNSYITKTVNGSIGCNYNDFDGDPAPGVVKQCEICQSSSGLRMSEKSVFEKEIDFTSEVGNLSIYPNPITEGDLNLDFGVVITGKVEIFNVSGKMLFSKTLENEREMWIAHNALESGVLLLKVSYNNDVKVSKLIVR